ncbi:hypothetical protein GCM10028807_58100 [Spirosoma daeguense]
MKTRTQPTQDELETQIREFNEVFGVEDVANQMTDNLSVQLDELILTSVQKHIPEFNRANAANYAHRLSIVQEQGKRYPQRYCLDHGTPDEKLLFELNEPVIELGDMLSYSQTYKQ